MNTNPTTTATSTAAETLPVTDLHARLRASTQGSSWLEAATELLIRADGGRLAQQSQPWIRVQAGSAWIDVELLQQAASDRLQLGYEDPFLVLAASLLEETWAPRPLMGAEALLDMLTSLPRPDLDLILATIAHAGDRFAGGRIDGLPSLHPWPEPVQP